MQFLDMLFVYKSKGKDCKRDYVKEKLRENMGQSGSKERDFKEQKTFRSEVLKHRKEDFK
jgi:hypothetical protein